MKQPAQSPTPIQAASFQFISASSHFLNCKICSNLMKKPIRAHRCGHTFCASCIEPTSIKNCPLCMEKIINKQKDLLASKLVGELAVRCLNNGCPWKGTYEQFLNFHEKSCRLKEGGIQGWLKQLQNAIGNNVVQPGLGNQKEQKQQEVEKREQVVGTYENSQDEKQRSRDMAIKRIQLGRISQVIQGQKQREEEKQVDELLEKHIKIVSQ